MIKIEKTQIAKLKNGRVSLFALLAALLVSGTGFAPAARAQVGEVSPETVLQIAAITADKATRSAAQQKLDSQLIYAARANLNLSIVQGAPELQPDVKIQNGNRVLVDIRAIVSVALLQEIVRVGGQIVNSFPNENAIRALLPLPAIEGIAARPEVRFIQRAVEFENGAVKQDTHNQNIHTPIDRTSVAPRQRRQSEVARTSVVSRLAQNFGGPRKGSLSKGSSQSDSGSLNSQGDSAHRADVARSNFGIDGTGIKIGVLSDGVGNLSVSQGSGDLPANVTVLTGQGGSGREGTAMLEIIHDLAPGAQLFYATAFGGTANFANNIRALRAAGCDVIVDDIRYNNESPFQAGPVEQAVYDVSNDGALYFSSAGNAGNKNDGTSSVWVGDFADGGAATTPPYAKSGNLHDFGGSLFNTISVASTTSVFINFHWSDPLGASTNDYDVYLVNSSGAVIRSSTNTQNGTQDPFELISPYEAGNRVVVVKTTGAANRYLYVGTGRGKLSISTAMFQNGHNAAGAANAFSVAAVPAPNRPFNGTDVVETFSSDGPRRIFYNPDGSPITPGNFSSSGGLVLQKPDIAAADRVSTTVPGFTTFSGTSAAAPHVAAIAALLLSYNPQSTPAQIRAAMQNTAIDIEAPGVDRDAGFGIPDVQAAAASLAVPAPRLIFAASALTGGNGNGVIDPNECNTLAIALRNAIGNTGAAATGITATLSSATSGVTIVQPTSTYPDIANGATQTNVTPFQISTNSGFVCGTNLNLTLTVSTSNAGSFSIPLQLATGVSGVLTRFESTDIPKAIPDNNTVGIDSVVNVSGISGPVGKVTVTLYITHTYDADIRASLIAPDGTQIPLFDGVGGSGNNFGSSSSNRTVLDDAATLSLNDSSPPFVGTFTTYGALAALRGKGANGDWKLHLEDNFQGDIGTLRNWSISVAPLTCTDGGGSCAGDNAAPIIDLNGPAAGTAFNTSFTRGNGAVPMVDAANLSVSDADNANLSSATLTLNNRLDGANEILAVTPSGAIAAANIAYANGVLTITANAPLADYQTVLRSATYNNLSANPDTTARTINFVVSDGTTNSEPALATVQVLAPNRAPVAAAQTLSTGEDTALNITLAASDADNNALTFAVVALPQNGALSGTAPNLIYTPNANFNGSDSFTFKANDGAIDSNIATITLQLLAVGDPPVAAAQSVSTNEDTALNIILSATDIDSTTLTFAVVANPVNGTLSGTAPNLVYTPNANYNGSDVFTFKANDGSTDSNVATIALAVTPINDVPSFTIGANQTVNSDAGEQVTAGFITNLSAGPPNENTQKLAFVVTNNNNALFAVQPTIAPDGTLNYTPASSASGVANVRVILQDDGGVAGGGLNTSAAQTFTITVNAIAPNNAPVANNQTLRTPQNTPVTFALTATDADDDELTFRILTRPQNGTLTGNAERLIYRPNNGFTGSDSLTFVANDGKVDSNIATITLQVLATIPTNTPPVAQSAQLRTVKATPLLYTLRASDADDDALTFRVVSPPKNGKLSGDAEKLTYTPDVDFTGNDSFTFVANDGSADSNVATITVQVLAGDNPPPPTPTPVPVQRVQALNDSYNLILGPQNQAQNAGVTLLNEGTFRIAAPGVLTNDRTLPGQRLSARLSSGPQNGRVQLSADGSFDYRPDASFVGTDEFSYTLSDGQNSDTARVRLIVLDRRAPELRFDTPRDASPARTVIDIRGRVRDPETGVKSMSLLWRRLSDKAFWNGSEWTSTATPLPLTVEGTFWNYEGALPENGSDRTVDLLDGEYAMRVTAVDNAGNTSRLTIQFTVDSSAPTAPEFSQVRLSSAGASAAQGAIALRFTGALDVVSAIDTLNYAIAINGVEVENIEASYASNLVTLSDLELSADDEIELRVDGLRDASGKVLRGGMIQLIAR